MGALTFIETILNFYNLFTGVSTNVSKSISFVVPRWFSSHVCFFP